MKKLTFDKLMIEITRKCNMNCKHCFRGEPEEINVEHKYIDDVLSQTEIIGSLFFTGGEPTLNINTMRYVYENLIQRQIPLFDFGFITNGLLFNKEIVDTIKKFSDLVKLCNEIGMKKNIDVQKYVVIGISIDKYHNHRNIVEQNYKKYKQALNGYAQVVIVADGNIPRKEGRGKHLKDGLIDLGISETVKKRIEILDKDHKPLCPQYQTYKMIKPDQTIICCEIYLDANGYLLTSSMGLHAYSSAKAIICKSDENIFNAILRYNEGRYNCCTILRNTILQSIQNPFNKSKIHDGLYLLTHKDEDNSETIIKERQGTTFNLDDIIFNGTTNRNTLFIDAIKRNASLMDYKGF